MVAEETICPWHFFTVENLSTFLFCATCICALVVISFSCGSIHYREISPHIFWLALVPTFIALARFLQTKNRLTS